MSLGRAPGALGLPSPSRLARLFDFVGRRGVRSCHNLPAELLSRLGPEGLTSFKILSRSSDLLIASGTAGGRRVVAHVALEPSAIPRITRYSVGLKAARSRLDSVLGGLLPELLAAGDTFAIQTFTDGQTVDPVLASPREFGLSLEAALNLAARLHGAAIRRSGVGARAQDLFRSGEDEDFLLAVPPDLQQILQRARSAFGQWQLRRQLPMVPMHGDFWLANLRFTIGHLTISGVVDWEWYRDDGLPLIDAIHLIFMDITKRQGIAAAWPHLWEGQDQQTRALISRACDIFGTDRTTFQWLGIAAWLALVIHGAAHPRPRNIENWMRDAVGVPGTAVAKWLETDPPSGRGFA
jgi:hypothetical protein